MSALWGTPEQKVAAVRSAWTALGAFLTVWIATWLITDASLLDKDVLGPGLASLLAALFSRGFVEGQIDRGKGA